MDERELITLKVSIATKIGAPSVYGAYELGSIIAVGCKELGYDIKKDEESIGENEDIIYAFIDPIKEVQNV